MTRGAPSSRSRRPARRSARRSGRRCGSSSSSRRVSTRRPFASRCVSEGERGLLGVGYAPARVVASVDADAISPEPAAAEPAGDEGELAADSARAARPRSRERLGVHCRVEVSEDDETVTASLDRRRPRAPDRPARPDDRRDPVPRERDRVARATATAARTWSSTRPATASAAARRSRRWRCAAPSGRSPRASRSSSSR